MEDFDQRIAELEEKLGKESSPRKKTKKQKKEPVVSEKRYYRATDNDVAKDIIEILGHGRKTTSELLAAVRQRDVCSQATLFRYLKKLTRRGKIKRKREGRHVFYSVGDKK